MRGQTYGRELVLIEGQGIGYEGEYLQEVDVVATVAVLLVTLSLRAAAQQLNDEFADLRIL